MSETEKKKKRQRLENVSDLDAMILEQRQEAKIAEEFLKAKRAKLAERDPATENFLKKDRNAVRRYRERASMHFEVEQMPEKGIVEEKW